MRILDCLQRIALLCCLSPWSSLSLDDASDRQPHNLRNLRRYAHDESVDEATLDHTRQEDPRRSLQNIGIKRCMIILVQFTDHMDYNLPQRAYFDELCNGSGNTKVNPVGSLADYFETQSYGMYKLECDVFDWRTTDNTEAYYAQGVSGRSPTAQQFFWPVLTAIDEEQKAIDPFWLSQYDQDNGGIGDGYIDCLMIIHSGIAAQAGVEDCKGNKQVDRFWSQGGGLGIPWEDTNGDISASDFLITSAFDDNCDDRPTTMGIVAHEQ
jgi:M6 family metalloprotease-like protein